MKWQNMVMETILVHVIHFSAVGLPKVIDIHCKSSNISETVQSLIMQDNEICYHKPVIGSDMWPVPSDLTLRVIHFASFLKRGLLFIFAAVDKIFADIEHCMSCMVLL